MAELSQGRIWGGSIDAYDVGPAMRSVGAPVRLEHSGILKITGPGATESLAYKKRNIPVCDTHPFGG